MTRYLCISVTFLDPLFHGAGDDGPEWPPAPMRLFQALLAGSRAGCRGRDWTDAHTDAFQWLERQPPPLIVTPAARLAPACTFFVPNNDGDAKFDRHERLTGKVAHPHRLCDGDTLHYLWPLNEGGASSHAELLGREARHLLALGWGIDQVVGNGRILTDAQVAELPGNRWRAWTVHRPGQRQWRVPRTSSLADLENVHRSFLQRVKGKRYDPPLKPRQFDRVTYLSAAGLPPRSYAAFEFPDGVAFRQEDANKVAAMLRSVACRDQQQDDFRQQFPESTDVYLAGHASGREETPARFSYLPLPTIGHEHADGMIRRVLIAEPYGGDGSHAAWAQNRLCHETLSDSDGNERGMLLDLWRTASRDMVQRYVPEKGCRNWSTVTPVVLPGFDHGKQPKAEQLFLRVVQQAGLPIHAVAELALRKAAFWPGSQHPLQYYAPNYLANHPRWHAHLKFHHPIPGPLALGAGRHCGLGIFAAFPQGH